MEAEIDYRAMGREMAHNQIEELINAGKLKPRCSVETVRNDSWLRRGILSLRGEPVRTGEGRSRTPKREKEMVVQTRVGHPATRYRSHNIIVAFTISALYFIHERKLEWLLGAGLGALFLTKLL